MARLGPLQRSPRHLIVWIALAAVGSVGPHLPLSAGGGFRQTPTSSQSVAALAGRLDAYLRPFVETGNLSGVVFVSRRGEVLFEKAYGRADLNSGVPNASNTRFHIASVSKAFTAAAILLLEERGKLRTTDTVANVLEGYPSGEKLRLDHLLAHSAGVPNVSEYPELSAGRYVPYTAAQLVSVFKEKPLDFEPGSRTRYSNSNYILLAHIVEKVSGQSFGDFLDANVVGPLNLRSTVHDADARRVIANLAVGTEPEGLQGVKHVPYLAWSTKTGSGSIVSSASDLCTFASALFDGQFLKPASLDKIVQAKGTFPYGWTDIERLGRKGMGVGGRSPGFISSLEYFPDDGTCVSILTNSYASVGQVIAPDISALVFGGSAAPPPIAYVRPKLGELAAFTGRFQMPEEYYAPGAILTLIDRSEYIEAKWTGGATTIFYPTGADDFVDRMYWAMVRFSRDGSGRVTGFTYDLLQKFTVRKLPD